MCPMFLRSRVRRVYERLASDSLTITTAESLTGGLIAAAITSIPGSSRVYSGGFVSYSETMKNRLLGVEESLIARHGVVSVEVAASMATGALDATDADVSVAVTGIAGPGGGTADLPVGTVCLACARRTLEGNPTVVSERVRFHGSRSRIRARTVLRALDLVLRHLDS
jgi:nicotinamide-nucleotide amidase